MVLERGFAPPKHAKHWKGLKTLLLFHWDFLSMCFCSWFLWYYSIAIRFLVAAWVTAVDAVPFTGILPAPLMPENALTPRWHGGFSLVNTQKAKAHREGILGSKVSSQWKNKGANCPASLCCTGLAVPILWSLIPLAVLNLYLVFVLGSKGRAFCVQERVTAVLLMGLNADGVITELGVFGLVTSVSFLVSALLYWTIGDDNKA